jgi:hypothetical protein
MEAVNYLVAPLRLVRQVKHQQETFLAELVNT